MPPNSVFSQEHKSRILLFYGIFKSIKLVLGNLAICLVLKTTETSPKITQDHREYQGAPDRALGQPGERGCNCRHRAQLKEAQKFIKVRGPQFKFRLKKKNLGMVE